MRPTSTVSDLARALSTWSPGAPDAATWLLPELSERLGASFVGTYRPVATESGWGIDFMHGAGETAEQQVRGFRRYVATLPASNDFLLYNPHHVSTAQRNRVMLHAPRLVAKIGGPLYQAVGLPGHQQIRVLVCSGSRLLCWLGAVRPEPFDERDALVLRRLTRPLQRRLRLENRLRSAAVGAAALEIVLERLRRPAFVVGPTGAIDFVNRAGVDLLQRDRRRVLSSIRESERNDGEGGFSVTRLTAVGCPAYVLAIADQPASAGALSSLAQRRWGLTARQTVILEHLLDGATNKEIASRAACAEVTVENHITELYRRSGARSRTDLVRRVFVLGGS
jgi:DNA-binding CsgD family transcriptional regulator